jgi:SSS family solute:Na+ symporter
MITGSTIAVGGIVVHQVIPDFFINGQMFWGIAMAASSLVYILVSLLGKRQVFDMDRMLHRGRYDIKHEIKVADAAPVKGLRVLGLGKEFTRGDKIIALATYAWMFGWTVVFLVGSIYNLTHDVSNTPWMQFWKIYVWVYLVTSVIVIVWFSAGGIINLKEMIGLLKTIKRDDRDSGFVVERQNLDEVE